MELDLGLRRRLSWSRDGMAGWERCLIGWCGTKRDVSMG